MLADSLGASSADGISLAAATIDHGLRAESADEADAVAQFCSARGIPHLIRRWGGDKPKAGLSAAAREARYALLMDIADELDATAILTGHTLDDQRETVAMRAARSDDHDNLGLAGMAEEVLLQRRRWLLRPFLSTRRADIRLALVERDIAWLDDPSNTDPHYERVRMRQALATEALSVSREIFEAGERRRRLSEEAAGFLRRHATLQQGVLAHIGPAGLDEPQDVLRHGLAALAAVLGGREHGLRRESLDRIMAFVGARRPGRITAGRVIFDMRREGLYMQRENRGLPSVDVLPGEDTVWDGRYRIDNASDDVLRIASMATDREAGAKLFPDVPPSVAFRAMSVMPKLESLAGALSGRVRMEVMAPFERFLPSFDLEMARQIGVLLGCNDFPLSPVNVSRRKS
nr:tRNA lysidine(34) synthetase TilS [Neorhizobium lilium]